MVTQADLLASLRELAVDIAGKNATMEEVATLRERVHAHLHAEAPLSQLGWDSVQMTWLLVRIEERYEIDTSGLSLFELFTVGDLLKALEGLVAAKAGRG